MATSKDDVYETFYTPPQAFEGAVTNYKMELKGLVRGEPDMLAARELLYLRQRSDYLVRNNNYAKTLKRKYLINLGSLGIKWVYNSGKKKDEVHKDMQNLWDNWILNPSYDGYGDIDNLQQGWFSAMWQSGESLSRFMVKRRKGVTIPLTVQNIPAEYLDPLYSGQDILNTRNGITFKDGEPSLYHFDKTLRNVGFLFSLHGLKDREITNYINNWEKIIVPAEDVIHIFQREKEGQWRGIPELAVNILPLFQLDDLTDGVMAKQIAAQFVTWVIQQNNTGALTPVGNAVNSFNENDLDPQTGQRRIIMKGTGGGVLALTRGQTLQQVQSAGLGTEIIDLMKLRLHSIAEGSGLKYAVLTGDWNQLSFSALQQIAIDLKVEAEFIYNFFTTPLGLAKLCAKFKEYALVYGSGSLEKAFPKYQFPRRYSVNELKDAQADVLELQSGLTPAREILNERGWTEEEIELSLAWMKADGLFKDLNASPNTAQASNVKPNPNTKG